MCVQSVLDFDADDICCLRVTTMKELSFQDDILSIQRPLRTSV